jgi:hypothetical protein
MRKYSQFFGSLCLTVALSVAVVLSTSSFAHAVGCSYDPSGTCGTGGACGNTAGKKCGTIAGCLCGNNASGFCECK